MPSADRFPEGNPRTNTTEGNARTVDSGGSDGVRLTNTRIVEEGVPNTEALRTGSGEDARS